MNVVSPQHDNLIYQSLIILYKGLFYFHKVWNKFTAPSQVPIKISSESVEGMMLAGNTLQFHQVGPYATGCSDNRICILN